ncbi:MAG: transketolase family protein [Christensenellaceae bacterium]|jgi:transketolase|nr:transketolase family protein [Christensenellaceae bacterium]
MAELKAMEMREVLVAFLDTELSKEKGNVVLLEADLASCSKTVPLMKKYPDKVINVGIAEQNMCGAAAGLSAYGFVPFIHSFGPFVTRRIADQLMISVCYAKQNVKIIGSDPGIAAELNGGTHMPLEDIGMLRSIPNIVIYEPTDNVEFAQALPQILAYKGAVYVRMFRKVPSPIFEEGYKFDLFKANVLKPGKDVSIFASGVMVQTAVNAAKLLEEEGINAEIVVVPTVKPIDAAAIIKSVKKTGAAVTAENHNVIGGLRSAVAEVLAENYPAPLTSVGVKEKFGEVGKIGYLRKAFNLEEADIVAAAKAAIARK